MIDEGKRHQEATRAILHQVADGTMDVLTADYKMFMAYYRHDGALKNIGKGLKGSGNLLEEEK